MPFIIDNDEDEPLKVISILGKGAQGQVALCQYKKDLIQNVYAVKIYSHSQYRDDAQANSEHIENI